MLFTNKIIGWVALINLGITIILVALSFYLMSFVFQAMDHGMALSPLRQWFSDAGALLMQYLFVLAFLLPDPAKSPFPLSWIYYGLGYLSAYLMVLPFTLFVVFLIRHLPSNQSQA